MPTGLRLLTACSSACSYLSLGLFKGKGELKPEDIIDDGMGGRLQAIKKQTNQLLCYQHPILFALNLDSHLLPHLNIKESK